MTIDEMERLLHKALQDAPNQGDFFLLGCIQKAMNNEQDQSKLSSVFTELEDIFLVNFGQHAKSGHSQLYELNEEGRHFKALEKF